MTDKNSTDSPTKNDSEDSKESKIVIAGVTEEGDQFRPSDWAERMSGSLSTVDSKHRVVYSPLLQPAVVNGEKCMLVDPSLKDSNPALYESILEWARTNHLKICKED